MNIINGYNNGYFMIFNSGIGRVHTGCLCNMFYIIKHPLNTASCQYPYSFILVSVILRQNTVPFVIMH